MTITAENISKYRAWLAGRRKAPATVQKYLRFIASFAAWLGDRALTPELLAQWVGLLSCAPATANTAISALNSLTAFLGRPELHMAHNRVESPYYRPADRDLGRDEYERMLLYAKRNRMWRIYYAAATLCGLGIRVSELRFITVEAVRGGAVSITNKGKTRTVLIEGRLRERLARYAREQGIASGPIIVTRTGRAVSRGQLWAELKRLAALAGVTLSKVFPHNLRHLFAVVFYERVRDIFELSKLLGHSSVKTTQIYLRTSSVELGRKLDGLRLIV